MKTIAWLAGLGTLLAGVFYMVVSLNRWEWNRALFFGLIVLIAEIALATGLVLRRLARLEHSLKGPADSDVVQILRETRPTRDRFAWMRESTGQLNVFITFLVGGGVLLSGIAWVVDRVASKTSSPAGEERLARQLYPISYPSGGSVARRHHRAGPGRARRRRRSDPSVAASRRPSVTKLSPVKLALGTVGLAVGIVGVLALREATLSTHEEVDARQVELVVAASSAGGEPGQTLGEMVEAQLLTCRLEVTSDLAGPIEDLGDGRFRAVFEPAMDETNRRQFRGCVEDFVIDHLQVNVVEFNELD